MDILLVEDNSADAYLLTEVFARKKDAPDIHWVTNGYHALDYVFQRRDYSYTQRPDIILLDLNMPRITGFEVLKELKDDPSLATIPVVILTTSRDPLDHSQCKALGADMCLSKPHALNEFEDMVQRLLNWASLRLPHVTNERTSVH